jgi:hypothetical protein
MALFQRVRKSASAINAHHEKVGDKEMTLKVDDVRAATTNASGLRPPPQERQQPSLDDSSPLGSRRMPYAFTALLGDCIRIVRIDPGTSERGFSLRSHRDTTFSSRQV